MNSQERFDLRIADIHALGRPAGHTDIRHEEFMAMADAFLGPDFDRDKLAEVEALQLEFHSVQAKLYAELEAKRIGRSMFVDECNKISGQIAAQCEKVLGPSNFRKMFGASASELSNLIDRDVFLQAP